MKKFILAFLIAFILSPACFASDNYIAYSDSKTARNTRQQNQIMEKEVRNFFKRIASYTNNFDAESLKKVYANNYLNSDGFDKTMYFDLVDKTWKLYPDIKYNMNIDRINIVGNTAIVTVNENATATTTEKIDETEIKGYLKSYSDSVYYLEKVGDDWIITSDSIISEKTTLTYGEANEITMDLVVPQLVPAGKEYTASLKITVPDKKMLTIASIGQERITYPHINAQEVFRKLPESGILERIFTANNDNYNEYTVGSAGITRAKVNSKKEIRLVVTGLGYVITRTNIIPAKDFSKVKENGKKETTAKLVE